jgi:hypothetical protein
MSRIKGFLFIGLVLSLLSCDKQKRAQNKEYREIQKSQRELARWLMSQPQEVRDEFKRDFVFSKGQIDSLVNSLKDTTIQK